MINENNLSYYTKHSHQIQNYNILNISCSIFFVLIKRKQIVNEKVYFRKNKYSDILRKSCPQQIKKMFLICRFLNCKSLLIIDLTIYDYIN